MNRSIVPVAILLLGSATAAAGEDSNPSAVGFVGPKTVVLRNGRVLTGAVREVDGRLEIRESHASLIRMPLEQVEFVAADLRAAYQQQAGRLRGGLDGRRLGADGRPVDNDQKERLAIVDWCLRQELLDEAAFQLHVLSRGGEHRYQSQVGYYERRLSHLKSQRNARQLGVRAPDASSARTGIAAPTAAERLAFVKGLPDALVSDFTHKIQPMLVNRCGAVSCHGGAGKSAYRLLQPGRGGTFSYRYTQSNLHATAERIQGRALETTPWMRAWIEPHAGRETQAFGARDVEELQLLVGWARRLASQSTLDAGLAGAARRIPETAPGEASGASSTPVRPATFTTRTDRPGPSSDRPAQEAPRTIGWESPQAASRITRDPFDPAPYNARHFPKDAQGRRQEPPQSPR